MYKRQSRAILDALAEEYGFSLKTPFKDYPDDIKDIIIKMCIRDRGTTVLVVTHNMEIVQQMKKRTITMSEGKIISDQEKGGYTNGNVSLQIPTLRQCAASDSDLFIRYRYMPVSYTHLDVYKRQGLRPKPHIINIGLSTDQYGQISYKPYLSV